MYANELYHYGILGQRWGIRRFQPYPSGYTGNGRVIGAAARANANQQSQPNQSGNNRPMSEKEFHKTVDILTNKPRQIINDTKSIINKTAKRKNDTSDVDLETMSDEELRRRIDRMSKEEQYKRLLEGRSRTVEAGKSEALRTLDVVGDVVSIAGSALAIAIAIQKLKGG